MMEFVISTHPIEVRDRLSRFVLGFYQSVEHAEEALHALRKNQYWRSGVVHRTVEGELEFFYAGLSPINRAAAATAVALLVVRITALIRSNSWELVLAAAAGFGMTWLLTLWFGF